MTTLTIPHGFLRPTQDPSLAGLCTTLAQDMAAQTRSATPWPLGDPSPEADTLRHVCRTDRQRFASEFFPDICTKPWSQLHRDLFAQRQRLDGLRGWRCGTAAPRGSAKSSLIGKIFIAHDLVYSAERYTILCSANMGLAVDKVREVRDLLTTNAKLRHYYGPQQTRDWRQGDFITQTGCRLRAFSEHSRVRGLLWGALRPTKILFDDAEDPESVLTELRRQRFWDWYTKTVTPLGTSTTNFEIIGTLLHPQSFLARILENPGYQTRKYQAVLHFADAPEAVSLWTTWRGLVLDLDNPHRLDDAAQFFAEHTAPMLEGAQTLWPEEQDYYTLMLSRLIDGESTFWQERQNAPGSDHRYLFDMAEAAYCEVSPQAVIRSDGSVQYFLHLPDTVAYWDPVPDKPASAGTDFAACPVVTRDPSGYLYVLDCYLQQETSTDNQIAAIVDLLWQWQVTKMGIERNGFQSLLTQNLREAIAQRAHQEGRPWHVDLVPILNTRNKVLRIKSLEPLVSNGWLQFSDTLPSEYYRQFAEFVPLADAGFDDGPDATEGCIRVLRGLYDKKAAF